MKKIVKGSDQDIDCNPGSGYSSAADWMGFFERKGKEHLELVRTGRAVLETLKEEVPLSSNVKTISELLDRLNVGNSHLEMFGIIDAHREQAYQSGKKLREDLNDMMDFDAIRLEERERISAQLRAAGYTWAADLVDEGPFNVEE